MEIIGSRLWQVSSEPIFSGRKKKQIRISSTSTLILSVALCSLTTFLGSATSLFHFKLLALLTLALTIFTTVVLLKRYWKCINFVFAIPMLFFLSVLPLIRISFQVIPTFDSRAIIDGLLINGPYYYLPFAGLALLASLSAEKKTAIAFFKSPLVITTVVILGLATLGYYSLAHNAVSGLYSVYNNLLIPLALGIFFARNRWMQLLGWASLVAMIFFVAIQGGRSYLLVSVYILFAYLFLGRKNTSKVIFFVGVAFLAVVLQPLLSFLVTTFSADFTIFSKLNVETLVPVFWEFVASGDFMVLFYWEGNSRAQILLDAFGDYDAITMLVGSGINATYQSFVVRNTIEIGYAQELFWLGGITIIPAITFTVMSILSIRRLQIKGGDSLATILVTIAAVRILDGLIFGMPKLSLYMLLYWSSVMFLALKTDSRRRVLGVGSSQNLGVVDVRYNLDSN